MRYDLSVALRVYPSLNKKHLYFKTKYDLVKVCFDSLLKSLEGMAFEIMVILDGCPSEYENLFNQKVECGNLSIYNVDSIGNAGTFLAQVSLLCDRAKSEYVFLAEDDYFYIGKIKDLLGFAVGNSDIVDFVTPYDHPDYYRNHPFHRYRRVYLEYGNRIWKQMGSTTCTFLTTRKTLEETKDVLRYYVSLGDYFMWNLLTRKNSVLRFSHFRSLKYKMPFAIYAYLKNLSGKRYNLWAPEPTVATHLQKYCLSPGVDWDNLFT